MKGCAERIDSLSKLSREHAEGMWKDFMRQDKEDVEPQDLDIA